jgi:hypothetical protein
MTPGGRPTLWLLTCKRTLFVAAALAIGCGGSDSPEKIINPDAGRVRLKVSGTAACGVVFWQIGTDNNYPDGTDVTFPWVFPHAAASGDVVTLEARNCCGPTSCPNPPCALTITASVLWEGNKIATATTTDYLFPSCTPVADVSTSVP